MSTADELELADALMASISNLAERVDDAGVEDETEAVNGLPAMPTEQAIALLEPELRAKCDTDPEGMLEALAVLHLESGALLEEFTSDDVDPVDLV